MQALWNRLSSTTTRATPAWRIEALFVACVPNITTTTVTIDGKNIMSARSDISTYHLKIPCEDCLARPLSTLSAVVWYSRSAQLTGNHQTPCVTIGDQVFYGNVVITGVSGDAQKYQQCPPAIKEILCAAPMPRSEPVYITRSFHIDTEPSLARSAEDHIVALRAEDNLARSAENHIVTRSADIEPEPRNTNLELRRSARRMRKPNTSSSKKNKKGPAKSKRKRNQQY